MSKTSLILHGHFYQPPRENPKTGIIPLQPSAAPWLDWNERIYSSCYCANLSSRYLDHNGRIISLTNNYAYISFNFGATLLSWLDTHHPEVVDGLREADRMSIERLGHGNAMAQGFNHTILPLDKKENAELQIAWGVEDFIHHYKRDPEGMWLPECGVNETVIDLLVENGIKFIVLSPWQCQFIENEQGNLVDLESSPAPYREPYILTGKKGKEITAFFYEPGLASGISFGHYLRDADALYSTLLDIKNRDNTPLLHTATDGEIYGHHEPYGDMALAALIRKVNERNDFIFDNYASYMDRNPATKHAVLRRGEDNRGTSWSCSHGVSRWYKDCGCHTGGEPGWNQKWRTGLRDALNNLGDKIDSIFNNEVDRIFSGNLDSHELLKKAGTVFCGKVEMKKFVEELQVNYGFSDQDKTQLSHLLTGMKYKHFSFTSCGWFFNEISGIEPRQDIKYAIHAITLFQQFTREELMIPFLNDLKKAKSNIREMGDGMLIAQEEIKGLDGDVEAAVYFYMNTSMATPENWKRRYGIFYLKNISTEDGKEVQTTVSDTSTDEEFSFRILPALTIDKGINLYVTKIKESGLKPEIYHITNDDIPQRVLDEAYRWVDDAMVSIDEKTLIDQINSLKVYAMLLSHSKVGEMDARLVENLGVAMRWIRSLLKSKKNFQQEKTMDMIKDLMFFIQAYGRENEMVMLDDLVVQSMDTLSKIVSEDGLTEKTALSIISVLSTLREVGKEPDLRNLQNLVFEFYSGKKEKKCPEDLALKVFSLLNFG